MHREPPEIGGMSAQNAGLDAMPVEMTEKQAANRDESSQIDTRSTGEGVSVEFETKSSPMTRSSGRQSTLKRRLLVGVLGALILIAACVFGIPWIREMLNTVSTDDSYVNGHVTFVAPVSAARFPRFWWMTITVFRKKSFSPN